MHISLHAHHNHLFSFIHVYWATGCFGSEFCIGGRSTGYGGGLMSEIILFSFFKNLVQRVPSAAM